MGKSLMVFCDVCVLVGSMTFLKRTRPGMDRIICYLDESASSMLYRRELVAEPVIFGRSLHTQLPILWYLYTAVGS